MNRPQKTIPSSPYAPLPTSTSIRLLKFRKHEAKQVGDGKSATSVFSCSMTTKDLKKRPQYDCLSYTWNSPETQSDPTEGPPPSIMLNGCSVEISQNLYAAISALDYHRTRLENGSCVSEKFNLAEYIWIDQLCINQSDVAEKSVQVQMMGSIYEKARTVHIWLGDHGDLAEDVQYIIDFISSAPVSLSCLEDPPQSLRLYRHIMDKHRRLRSNRGKFADRWFSLYRFFGLPWFSRAWVVQEVALAATVNVLCGQFQINLTQILHLYGFLRDSRLLSDLQWEFERDDIVLLEPNFRQSESFFETIAGTSYGRTRATSIGRFSCDQFWQRSLSYPDLIQRLRSSQATDPRDKIYAFTGLAQKFSDCKNAVLSPDYSNSVGDVYVCAARAFIKHSARWPLSHFSFKEDASVTIVKSLPSWVPDFSVNVRHTPLMRTSRCWCVGTVTQRYIFPHTGLPYALTVRGTCVGKIQFLGREESQLCQLLLLLPRTTTVRKCVSSHEEVNQTGVHEHLEAPEMMAPSSGTTTNEESQPMLQSRFEVLWRTLLHDCVNGRHPVMHDHGYDILRHIERVLWCSIQSLLMAQADQPSRTAEVGLLIVDLEHERRKPRLDSDWPTTPSFPFWNPSLPHLNQVLNALYIYERDPTKTAHLAKFREYEDIVASQASPLFGRGPQDVHTQKSLKAATEGRVLFATHNGRLGTGLSSIQVGDEVWALDGCPVPCVLRQTGDGRYRLVGEAYVHGIMHGEAHDGLSGEDYRQITLV